MDEFVGEFYKFHTWLYLALYWSFIYWKTRRAGVKLGMKGIIFFGIIFMMSLLMTLAHPVIEGFLFCGFVGLMNYVFKNNGRH
jgi:predicted membrane protein